jgi:hypothetical protein
MEGSRLVKVHFKGNHILTVHDTQVVDENLVDVVNDKEYKLGDVVVPVDFVSRGDVADIYFSDTAVAYSVPSDYFEILPDEPVAPPPKKCCGRS